MRNYHVIKIGGSGLKNLTDVDQVVKLLNLYDDPFIIVSSAFYGVTNQLIRVINKTDNIYRRGKKFAGDVKELKTQIIDHYIIDGEQKNKAKDDLDACLLKLDKALLAAHCLGEVPIFLKDEILSFGERLCTLTLTHVLNAQGLEVEELLPENIPLITDGEFQNASIDCEINEPPLKEYLNGKSYIVPGFYGVSEDNRKTLLGRGGSDYSAACIANCVNALSLDIWKDVDGFLNADPEIIDNASNIERLTYDEASELSYFGAEILHPRTSEPLREKNIPVNLYNIQNYTNWPKPQTVINKKKSLSNEIVKGISYSKNFGIVKLAGAGVGVKPGILAKITAALDRSGINIKSVLTSQIAINLLVEKDKVRKVETLLKKENFETIESIQVLENVAVVAAIGEGLIHKDGVAARIFSAVAQKGINIEMICFGASPVAVYFVVKQFKTIETVRAIHEAIFSETKVERFESRYLSGKKRFTLV